MLTERQKAAKARYKARHPERVREQARRHHQTYYAKHREAIALRSRLRRHGLTPEQLESMRAAQEGLCAGCQREIHPNRGVSNHADAEHIDHCHITGAVRGLLCSRCNRALGLVDDRPDCLRALADYLEMSRA